MLNNQIIFFKDIQKARSIDPRYYAQRRSVEEYVIYNFLEHVRDTGGTHALGAKLLLEMLDEDTARWYA